MRKSLIPCSRSLFETIQFFEQPVDKIREFFILKTRRLIYIDFFSKSLMYLD